MTLIEELDEEARWQKLRDQRDKERLERYARNAIDHSVAIAAVLDNPPLKEVPQRVFRARWWDESETYIVATLVQNINFAPAAGQPNFKAHVFVSRSYAQGSGGTSVSQMSLVGQYSVDEIVAFLALDKVEASQVHWIDETKYSDLVVVGDILRKVLH